MKRDAVEALSVVAAWLASKMSGEPAMHHDFDTDTHHIRIEGTGLRPDPVLIVTQNALDDWPSEEIIADLESARIPSRLRQDPTIRPMYMNSREVPNFEWRSIRCEGKLYRVVRDSNHHVTIFDHADQKLENLPNRTLALGGSIYQRTAEQWCAQIREWRGEEQ